MEETRIQVAQPSYGSTAGFQGITDVLYYSYCYYYCYWLPSGRTWFSTRCLGRGSGYVRNPSKA